MTRLAIEVKGLVKRFEDVEAVAGVDLEVPVGQCVGLLVRRWETDAAWLRERIGIALLVADPELFFLDEPTTGLDPRSRRALWDVIEGLKSRGRTVVLTTHYMEEAEALCDRVIIMDHGRIVAQGTPAERIASVGGGQVVELTTAPELPDVFLALTGRSLHEEHPHERTPAVAALPLPPARALA